MKNEKVETFLAAFEWLQEKEFIFDDFKLHGFCSMLCAYLQSQKNILEVQNIYTYVSILRDPLIYKHKPKDSLSYWFEPTNWEVRKEIYLKVKEEYNNEQTSF